MDKYNEENDILIHYGTPRHSGRYPWGSGKNPQRNRDLLAQISELKKQGLTQSEIAEAMGFKNTNELRAMQSISKAQLRDYQQRMARKLKDKGMSQVAIGERLGIGESQVRQLLRDDYNNKNDRLQNTSDILRESVEKYRFVDIGEGVSKYMGVSDVTLNTACTILEKEGGYKRRTFKIRQISTGFLTTVKILCPEDTTTKDIYDHLDEVHMPAAYTSVDGDIIYIHPPVQYDHKRVMVRYDTDDSNSGSLKDGVIELRRGVKELDMGNSRYAQVRIALDSGHYLKGMAVYNDNMPPNIDIIFNSNKKEGTPLDKVFKPQKNDPENPFGSTIDRQNDWVDDEGHVHKGALNIVREEGAWGQWKKSIASQVLSKQPVDLAKKQLNLAANERKEEFEEIMALTNPVLKKKLLEDFADQCDKDAVDLKAAAFPRQASHVILPVNSLKENEIFAPKYDDGEEVVLIRYPHGGRFEIPRLKVNNRNQEARSVIGSDAADAVGINSKVAEQLSGADFDGDSVLVIPTRSAKLISEKPLKDLEGFDPKKQYAYHEGMKVMKDSQKGNEMGKITNLITDMTFQDATAEELARAVKHSMVVIDAPKHKLDYKASYEDNGIAELKAKYQKSAQGGASTLISRAKSPIYVPKRETGRAYDIDPDTGKKIFRETGETRLKVVKDETGKKIFVDTGEKKLQKSKKMYEAEDAFTLSSGHPMEIVYANYANQMKALGNAARKASLNTGEYLYSPSAYEAYRTEVASLNTKLNDAIKNAPRERKAQMVARMIVNAKIADNPELEDDGEELDKVKSQTLRNCRARFGASKDYIKITDQEWQAIQAGAIRKTKLEKIIDNADTDVLRKLATPREQEAMTPAKQASAKAMLNAGYTIKEVADKYGVSTTTITKLRGSE